MRYNKKQRNAIYKRILIDFKTKPEEQTGFCRWLGTDLLKEYCEESYYLLDNGAFPELTRQKPSCSISYWWIINSFKYRYDLDLNRIHALENAIKLSQ